MREWFDRWVTSGDLTLGAIARFRVMYASFGLLMLPNFSWVSAYPDSWFRGPLGPMRLFDAFPAARVLDGVELLLAVAYAAVLVGWRTVPASWAVTLLAMVGYGFSYSAGKIDHGILFIVLPPLMAMAGWGEVASLDARRRAMAGAGRPAPVAGAPIEHWPVRLLALLTGLAFFTAAVPKLLGGWLAPDTQAVQATVFRQFFVHGRDEFLAGVFVDVTGRWFWEPLDVLTIVLEAGFLLAVLLGWRAIRVMCAVATLFHVGVLLMMNIAFFVNVVVYAAFVKWDSVRLPSVSLPLAWLPSRAMWTLPVAIGTATFGVVRSFGNAADAIAPVGVLLGGAVAAVYLAWLLVGAWGKRAGASAAAHTASV